MVVEYSCKDCHKKFSKKYNYDMHINSTNGCKNFLSKKKELKCKYCKKTYSRKDTLRRHIIKCKHNDSSHKTNYEDNPIYSYVPIQNTFDEEYEFLAPIDEPIKKNNEYFDMLENDNENNDNNINPYKYKIHYIYLLLEREFIKTNEPIYKIGKSIQKNTKRINSYPKGSILLLQTMCSNCHIIEKKLKQLFKRRYKLRNDIGHEYFEGNPHQMRRDINNLIDFYENSKSDEESNEESNEEYEKSNKSKKSKKM